MDVMQLIRIYGKGFTVGFLFGTVGIFVLALLSLMHPLFESLSAPILLPGRMLAAVIAGSSASSGIVVLLYGLTGLFYGFIGVIIQLIIGNVRSQK